MIYRCVNYYKSWYNALLARKKGITEISGLCTRTKHEHDCLKDGETNPGDKDNFSKKKRCQVLRFEEDINNLRTSSEEVRLIHYQIIVVLRCTRPLYNIQQIYSFNSDLCRNKMCRAQHTRCLYSCVILFGLDKHSTITIDDGIVYGHR